MIETYWPGYVLRDLSSYCNIKVALHEFIKRLDYYESFKLTKACQQNRETRAMMAIFKMECKDPLDNPLSKIILRGKSRAYTNVDLFPGFSSAWPMGNDRINVCNPYVSCKQIGQALQGFIALAILYRLCLLLYHCAKLP